LIHVHTFTTSSNYIINANKCNARNILDGTWHIASQWQEECINGHAMRLRRY